MGETKMKTIRSIGCLSVVVLVGCFNSTTITGADDVAEYEGAAFEVTEVEVHSNWLTARGTVENTGSTAFSPPWYIEGEFYADDSYKFKFGGDQYTINFPLIHGEKTAWELEFTSSLYIESDYPDFAVKNFRAFKETD